MTETQILIGFIVFMAVFIPLVALMVRGLKPVEHDCRKQGHDWNLGHTRCMVCEFTPYIDLTRERAIRNSPFGPIRSKVVEPKR